MSSTTTNFATARDVSTAIQSLGFQATTEVIGIISRTCRDDFLANLSACISGQDTDGANRKAIELLLRCLSPEITAHLQSVVPSVQIEAVVKLARTLPNRLLSAIEASVNPDHPRHIEAKKYLTKTFAQPSGTEQKQPTVDLPPAPELQHNPENQSRRSAPHQAPATNQTQETENKYESCHVYGGSYALCFNTGTWEGKPGIMLDAAASLGPKAYDWQNAIHIWLNTNEIAAVLAVFRRWRKSVEFSAHGAQNDKGFSIEFQGQHFFAKASARKAESHPARAVKILPGDATAVSIMFLKQLATAYPDVPLPELLATVRAAHQLDNVAA